MLHINTVQKSLFESFDENKLDFWESRGSNGRSKNAFMQKSHTASVLCLDRTQFAFDVISADRWI